MPFRKKGTKNWNYDFKVGGCRFQGSCGTDSFEEAKAIEAEARHKAKNDPQVRGKFTVSEALGTYFSDICQHQPSARTARSQAKMILTALSGKTPLDTLTNAVLMRMVSKRRAKVSNATSNREIDMLARSIRHMAKVHKAAVPDLDFTKAKTPEAKERVRELSFDEQDRLFEHLREDMRPMVTFALMTGARRGTICALRWKDINDDTDRMTFQVKGGGTQSFPVTAEIRALLSALPRSNVPGHRRLVFTYLNKITLERMPYMDGGGVWEDWAKAVRAAGIEDFRFHDLRHTFATRMLRATGNLKIVSRLLGHANIETTMRYAHVLDSDLADAMDDFSAMQRPTTRRGRMRGAK